MAVVVRGLVAAAAAAAVLAVAQPSGASMLGPTPDGAGNWVICNWAQYSGGIAVACTYGVGPDGLAPVAITARGGGGAYSMAVAPVGGEVRGVTDTAEGFSIDLVTASYGGQERQGLLLRRTEYRVAVPMPETHYQSGVSGVPATAGQLLHPPDPAVLGDVWGPISEQVRAWVTEWAVAVMAAAGTVTGLGLVVAWLRRAFDVAGGEGDTFERGYLGEDGFGGLVEVWEADEADDDGSDDEGEDETSAGISDDTECVQCGCELEFGWDYDYCEPCGAMA